MNFLGLNFSGGTKLELVGAEFNCSLAGGVLKSIRGKDSIGATGSFQWTQSVQALVILLLRARLSRLTEEFRNQLSGLKSTPASSLDYTLSKPPLWMLEMFGYTESGEPIIRRLFKRVNSEQKLPGPVTISLNDNFLSLDNIKILIEGVECGELVKLKELLFSVESSWKPARMPVATATDYLRKEVIGDTSLQLKLAFSKEIQFILRDSEIFTRAGQGAFLKRMLTDIESIKLGTGQKDNFLSQIFQRQLPSNVRLGIPDFSTELLDGLTVSCPLGSPTSLAIFNHIKLNQRIEIDFTYQHGLELMYAVMNRQCKNQPDLIVLGTAPAAIFDPVSRSYGYKSLMVLPGMTHRVLKPGRRSRLVKKPAKKTRTNFLMLNSDPSTSVMYFEKLKTERNFERRLSTVTHAEPDEIFLQLANGEEDIRSVLYFPYYEMNRVFNGSELIDNPTDFGNVKDSVLFVHESVTSNPKKQFAIERAIRDSWLQLRARPEEVKKSVDNLFEQPTFTTYLSRSSGLL